MEPHNHPEYEQTFSRVAMDLERVTAIMKAQVRRVVETDDRIFERLAVYIKAIDLNLSEATDKLKALTVLMDRQQRERGNN